MPNHRIHAVLRFSTLTAGLAIAGTASAQLTTVEFTDSGQTFGNSSSWSIALGDLNGDGDLDAFVANGSFDEPNTVWTNDGTGTLANSGQTLGNSNSWLVALGDFDGDGDLDAFVANFSAPNTVWTNNGSGTFTNSGQTLGNSTSMSAALGDFDGDGDLDAFVANFNAPNTIWTNDGSGTFTNSGQALGNNASRSVALGDLDGDSDLDALVTNANGFGEVAIWTNDGTGVFNNEGEFDTNNDCYTVALGDFDGDDDLDAMVTTFSKGGSTVWTNNGTGNFTNSGQALGNGYTLSVSLGDLDGDGDLDAMFADNLGFPTGKPNTVWTNDGTGIFTNSGQALGNSSSHSVALGDLDGDGDLDAMVANQGQSNTVWTNDASNISAVYNQNSGMWYESAREAISSASNFDTLLVAGRSFGDPGIIDSRSVPLTFEARSRIVFSEDLLFLPSDQSSFLARGVNSDGYVVKGAFVSPEAGNLVFSSLEIDGDGDFAQNDSQLLIHSTMNTRSGSAYLRGEVYAFGGTVATEVDGVNYVARDTDIYSDYTNAGSTIIQRGILYIYGDLTNTGTLSGDYNNGFTGGDNPESGDGFSIGGSYTIGQDATLSMPSPVWWLRVGGNLDIAIDDPANFGMSEATIELNGLAPLKSQELEAMSADLGPVESGFDSSNFPIGALRITSGSTTQLVNRHPNSGSDPCEVVYVNELVIESGGSLATGGCTIYTRSATINGEVDDPDSIVIIDEQPPCLGDLNNDGTINGADLGLIIAMWGTADGDLTGDGTTNGADLGLLIAGWGLCN